MASLKRHDITVGAQKISWLEAGDPKGPLIIFVHGWPDVAEMWRLQIEATAALGYCVIAPDVRGYGESTAPRDRSAYALELIVADMLALLQHVGRRSATWVGHDWGSGVVSALAGHHPEVVDGLALLAVPYRTIDLGFKHMLTLVNRDVYSEDEYPYGQFEYMQCYVLDPDAVDRTMDEQAEKVYKIFYCRPDPKQFGKPSRNARAMRDGFLGKNPLPDVPLEVTFSDESLYKAHVATWKKNGFFPASSYYCNSEANEAYSKTVVNGGVLDCPVLFINATYDPVCAAEISPKFPEEMRRTCKNLTEHTIEAAHWSQREKPEEVNAMLTEWLKTVPRK